MPIFDLLAPFDVAGLKFLNITVAHPWLDQFWLTITQLHKLWWMQMVVWPAVVIALFYRLRAHALKPLLMVALAVGLADGIGYRVIKSRVSRPRPFENPAVSGWVRRVGQAHGSSFPSNHAANSAAAAGVLGCYFTRRRKYFVTLAILVAASRVALGVHYPTDVLAGLALGATVAFFVNALIISPYPFWRLPVKRPREFTRNGSTRERRSAT